MDANSGEVEAILRRVEDTLGAAKQGLDDLLDPARTRRISGLRNLITFGRSVTFVIQNLRGVEGLQFDTWYEPQQAAMKADPLMRYFVDARNELEKQGKLSVTTSAHIKSFSTEDIGKFGRPPVGARSFFIGDQLGGSGWEVELIDGKTEKYYVDLPSSIGEVTLKFSNFPVAKAPEFADVSVDDLCKLYIAKLEELVRLTRAQFLPQADALSKRNRGHLRLVK